MISNIELIICTTDHAWGTDYIEVNDDDVKHWEEETVESVAIERYTKKFCENKKPTDSEIAYIGIYNIEELDELGE